MVGLIPLFAVETLEPGTLEKLPGFNSRRMMWFIHRVARNCAATSIAPRCPMDASAALCRWCPARSAARLSSRVMLDEQEFLSRTTASDRYHASMLRIRISSACTAPNTASTTQAGVT